MRCSIRAAQKDINSEQFFRQLERLCVSLFSEGREVTPEEQRDIRAIFELQIDRIKRREFSESVKLEIPDELAQLLAMPPLWFFGRETYKSIKGKESDFVDQIAAMTFGGPNLDEEFLKLYLQSEQSESVGDGKTSVEAAAKAFDLVRKNKHKLAKDVSPRLGNLGVNAEKFKVLELAEAIFRLAIEIDEHSGVLQQFVSYILDNRPDLYEDAAEVLQKLQSKQHANHRPGRTNQLLIQLMSQTGQDIGDDLIERLTQAAERETDIQQVGVILDALIRADRYELGLKLFRASVGRFPSRSFRYTIQRMVSDALARRSEAECEFTAMDLYRQILANPDTINSGDEPHVMHNYATLLYKHDYDDEAGCLWFTAYTKYLNARTDGGIRRAYSMYLLRTNRKELAQKVIDGDPIDEMALIPTDKSIPERFSTVDLPDALSESGKSVQFACLNSPRR